MVVSDDDGPDFVDELEAELAARRPVPVQQDEPEGVCAFPNCSCTENGCPGVGGEPCRGCGVPTGVGAYHHIGCRTPEPNPVPVQQDEPSIVGHGPHHAQGPEEGHKVVFQQRGDHEQRAWCCTCGWVTPWQEHVDHGSDQQVAARRHRENPVPAQQDTLLAYMGHERWVDAWREATDWRDQYRAERDELADRLRCLVNEVDVMTLHDVNSLFDAQATLDRFAGSESNAAGGSEKGAPSVLKHHACRTCGSLLIDCECPPSSEGVAGLRDRIKEAADLALDFTADELETLADALMSVLLEAGTFEQPDMVVELTGFTLTPEQREFVKRAEATFTVTDEVPPAEAGTQEDEQDSFSALTSDTGLIREVARANVELIDLSEKINAAVERWTAEAKRRKEDLTTAPAEAGTQEDGLDALARQFKNGQTVVWGDGPTQQGAVVGFGYTIPERPGGPDRPALVVRERWGERTGHVLPSELDAHAAVSGTPDTKEDAL